MTNFSLRTFQTNMLFAIQSQKNTPASLSVQPGFKLYQGSYQQTLNRVLMDIYPVVFALVGKIFFQGLALSYIQKYPLQRSDLDAYGDCFAVWIQNHPACTPVPYLHQVAQLEWACHQVSQVICIDAIQTPFVSIDKSACQLKPSVRIFYFDYPIAEIWHMHQQPILPDVKIDLSMGEEYIIVYQTKQGVCVTAVSREEGLFLQAVQAGKTLEQLALLCDEKGLVIEQILPQVFKRGWLMWV